MKTIKKVNLELIEVEFIPTYDKMEFGKFYYSKTFEVTNHLCICGCGAQTPLPIKESEWNIILLDNNNKFNISPSILHRSGCKSHYVINNNVANLL